MKCSVVFKRSVSVSLGLLFSWGLGRAAAPQGATNSTADAASQAYHELAVKNYAAAIQNFHDALAADPSNSLLRKDLGYAYLAAASREEAVSEFESVYRDHPEDFRTALELGYLSQQL